MATITRWTSYIVDAEDGTEGRGKVVLLYDTRHPLLVSVTFFESDTERADWTIGRDVLARRTPGLADVQIGTDGVWTALLLTDGVESGTVRILTAQVEAFLQATTRLVPYGAEITDLDAELDRLLKRGVR